MLSTARQFSGYKNYFYSQELEVSPARRRRSLLGLEGGEDEELLLEEDEYGNRVMPQSATSGLALEEEEDVGVAAQRRRQLQQLQAGELYTVREIQFAAELKELIWNPSVGIQDADAAYLFTSVWGRLFGGNTSDPSYQVRRLRKPVSGSVRVAS
eukprot:777335-Prorocentrum_minimum.AAC.2